MYRARVQAVSGNKVYANGKWLICIGNKNFSIGEPVWTDGRCAYGNFKESQQPLIITAPDVDEEGIPIAFSNNEFFSFKNNQLYFVGVSPKNIYTIINDYKNNVFACDATTPSVNIDRHGNIFYIIQSFNDDYSTIEIIKNNVTIKEINLDQLFREEIVDKCENPIGIPHQVEYSYGDYDTFNFFIDDDENWHFTFSGQFTKGLMDELNDDEHSPSTEVLPKENFYSATLLITNSQRHVLYERILRKQVETSPQVETMPSHYWQILQDEYNYLSQKIKINLYDGYYYTSEFYWTYPNHGNPTSALFRHEFFSPNNEKLLETLFSPLRMTIGYNLQELLIEKINGGYLLALNSPFVTEIFGEAQPFNIEERFPTGLYLYRNGVFKRLSGFPVNHRLRTMKKIKGWQNRIQEF